MKKQPAPENAQKDTRMACCGVEAIVTVDDRGQMVLPKDIREKAGIRAGDKLAIVSWEQNGQVCCISMVKVEDLTGLVKTMLGPVVKQVFQQ